MAQLIIHSTEDVGGGNRLFRVEDVAGNPGIIEDFEFQPADTVQQIDNFFDSLRIAVAMYESRQNPENQIVGKTITVDFTNVNPIRVQ